LLLLGWLTLTLLKLLFSLQTFKQMNNYFSRNTHPTWLPA
jgi:hypothetical protein